MLVKDIIGNEYEIDKCLGCEIASKNLNPIGGILYQNDYFTVAQDFELPIEGFIIISSIKHYERLSDLSDEERINLIELINKTLKLLKKYKVADEYNVILEEKEGYHFHVWLMPRQKWMIEKFGKVLKNIKLIQEYAILNMKTKENIKKIEKICERLKNDLNK